VSSDGQEDMQDERGRLIDAFTRLAAEVGYRGVEAPAVARAAGLPAEAFFHHFPSELGCLVAAQDAFVGRLRDDVAEAVDEEDEWAARVRSAVAACLECLADMESRARLFAVEAVAAGPAVLENRFAHTERAAAQLREGRRHFPRAEPLAETLEWGLVAGAVSRITSFLLAEQGSLLSRLEPELTELLLLPYLGTDEAGQLAAGNQA
jgi:AcrR family transcriptional regulator